MICNKGNQKFKINELNRNLCDKFIINEHFYDNYYNIVETFTNTYCICMIKSFLHIYGVKLSDEQLKICQHNMKEKYNSWILSKHHINIVYKCSIHKIIEKTTSCSVCNPTNKETLEDDKCTEIIHFFKKFLKKRTRSYVYVQFCVNMEWML